MYYNHVKDNSCNSKQGGGGSCLSSNHKHKETLSLFSLSALDFVEFQIRPGDNTRPDSKLALHIGCFSRYESGRTFARINLKVGVEELRDEEYHRENINGQPQKGTSNDNYETMHFTFYVLRNKNYLISFFDEYNGFYDRLMAVPIR